MSFVSDSSERLSDAWVFWEDKWERAPGNKLQQRLVELGEISTMKGFWVIYNAHNPIEIALNSSLSLFRRDVMPEWEDKRNIGGGHVRIPISPLTVASISNTGGPGASANSKDKDSLSQYQLQELVRVAKKCWLDITLALLGDQFDRKERVNGAAITRKRKGLVLSVWIDCNDPSVIESLSTQLCSMVGGELSSNARFVAHKDVAQTGGVSHTLRRSHRRTKSAPSAKHLMLDSDEDDSDALTTHGESSEGERGRRTTPEKDKVTVRAKPNPKTRPVPKALDATILPTAASHTEEQHSPEAGRASGTASGTDANTTSREISPHLSRQSDVPAVAAPKPKGHKRSKSESQASSVIPRKQLELNKQATEIANSSLATQQNSFSGVANHSGDLSDNVPSASPQPHLLDSPPLHNLSNIESIRRMAPSPLKMWADSPWTPAMLDLPPSAVQAAAAAATQSTNDRSGSGEQYGRQSSATPPPNDWHNTVADDNQRFNTGGRQQAFHADPHYGGGFGGGRGGPAHQRPDFLGPAEPLVTGPLMGPRSGKSLAQDEKSKSAAFVHDGYCYPPGLNRKERRRIQFSEVGVLSPAIFGGFYVGDAIPAGSVDNFAAVEARKGTFGEPPVVNPTQTPPPALGESPVKQEQEKRDTFSPGRAQQVGGAGHRATSASPKQMAASPQSSPPIGHTSPPLAPRPAQATDRVTNPRTVSPEVRPVIQPRHGGMCGGFVISSSSSPVPYSDASSRTASPGVDLAHLIPAAALAQQTAGTMQHQQNRPPFGQLSSAGPSAGGNTASTSAPRTGVPILQVPSPISSQTQATTAVVDDIYYHQPYGAKLASIHSTPNNTPGYAAAKIHQSTAFNPAVIGDPYGAPPTDPRDTLMGIGSYGSTANIRPFQGGGLLPGAAMPPHPATTAANYMQSQGPPLNYSSGPNSMYQTRRQPDCWPHPQPSVGAPGNPPGVQTHYPMQPPVATNYPPSHGVPPLQYGASWR